MAVDVRVGVAVDAEAAVIAGVTVAEALCDWPVVSALIAVAVAFRVAVAATCVGVSMAVPVALGRDVLVGCGVLVAVLVESAGALGAVAVGRGVAVPGSDAGGVAAATPPVEVLVAVGPARA